jgi:UDP-2-acetamido-2,6-beta-L-arabino-hexul-4-ose reductase
MINVRFDHAIRRRDERGFLVDFIKGDELRPIHQILGQIYFVTFEKPHVVRGNHFHKTKDEWFVVIAGKIKLIAEDIKTKKRIERILDGDNDEYERVFIGKNTAHSFQNISDIAMMLDYADKSYHNKAPDTIPYKLM